MAQFEWKVRVKNETKLLKVGGNKYKLVITEFRPNYRVDLFEGTECILSDNTSTVSFKDKVDTSKPVLDQVLQWGAVMLEHRKICPRCAKQRILQPLTENDKKYDSFEGYEEMCPGCRVKIYNEMSARKKDEQTSSEQKLIEEYRKNPPNIVCFTVEKDAEDYVKGIDNPDVEDIGDGFVIAKGVVKAANGVYYPVFLAICLEDGGEFYGAEFIADNYSEVIEPKHALPYLAGGKEGLYPFKYRSLSRLEGDWHQSNWPRFS